ncbi:MAG: hypothetical protein L0241_09705 [Planctomycetia bacterium]|nr:hypothetical protein [Planctomycetia bacterium]
MLSRSLALVLAVCLACLAGCGEPKPGAIPSPVEGVVTINGKTAENIEVRFSPDPAKGGTGPSAIGVTGPDGKYTLKTDDGRAGATVGWYVVTLTDLNVGRAEQGEAEKPSRVPADYQTATRTPLKVEVKAGPNTIPLEAK